MVLCHLGRPGLLYSNSLFGYDPELSGLLCSKTLFVTAMERPSPSSRERVKRRKIAVACDDCRSRKVRCDGVQPGMLLKQGSRNATRAKPI
jgi:hypothetical protein